MPYKIKEFNNGFKVQSDKGTLLSKKPLSKKQARKQMIAVSLHERIYGSGMQPPEKDFYLASKQSYNMTNDADKIINGLNLILETPTVKAYLNNTEKTILVAIRGTKPEMSEDLLADGSIAFNRLKYSNRYKKDANIVEGLLNQYPPDVYDYYLTGHSLAGAIIAQLKRDYPKLKNAVVYNPASQPYDYISQQSNEIKRLYTANDPLYNLGAMVFNNKQVIPTSRTLAPDLPFLGNLNLGSKAYNYYQGHALDNFKQVYGLGHPHLNENNYALHAVIFKKPYNLKSVIQESAQFTHKKTKPFIRETGQSYRVRNIPKTKFISKSFRTKRINDNISLVFGELMNKIKGGVVGERRVYDRAELTRRATENALRMEQQAKARKTRVITQAEQEYAKQLVREDKQAEKRAKEVEAQAYDRNVLYGRISDPEIFNMLVDVKVKPVLKPKKEVKSKSSDQIKKELDVEIKQLEADIKRKLNIGEGRLRRLRK